MLLLSQIDWRRILFTRTAAIILGIAAALSLLFVVLRNIDIDIGKLSQPAFQALSISGAAAALGFIALLVGMGFFWLRCDVSSKVNRTIWFVALALGFLYGSQIAYYAIVYLPAVLRRLRNPKSEEPVPEPEQGRTDSKRIGPFGRALFVGWGFLFLALAATLALPKNMSYLVDLAAACFFLGSALVVFEALIHVIVSLYRSGLSRPARSGRADSSHSRGRDKET